MADLGEVAFIYRRLVGARFAASATALEVLGEVAELYLDLLGAAAVLEAQRLSETQFGEVAGIVGAYAATGEGRPADARRAEADRSLLRVEVQRAEEDVAPEHHLGAPGGEVLVQARHVAGEELGVG